MLTVTKTGTFKIKVKTAANGIYANGEKTITLTVLPAKKSEMVKDDKSTGIYKVKDAAKKEVAYQIPAKKHLTTVRSLRP